MSANGYSFLDRLLHNLVLGFRPLTELTFAIEKAVSKSLTQSYTSDHVFICGLARAGTTMLMRAFYDTENFGSLTYREMPFVLMPNLWKKIFWRFRDKSASSERSHGDGIQISFDSPEALEEVFWRTFCGQDYIKVDRLIPHLPSPEVLEDFMTYIDLIIANSVYGSHKRYLSKNNNNLIRLHAIRRACPNALLIIPFRDPVSHAQSLLRQHKKFTVLQNENEFTRKYMNFLAHYEFGNDHKPFAFSREEFELLSEQDSDTLNYWLTVWKQTYTYLLHEAPKSNCIFVSYQHLCKNPNAELEKLFELSSIVTDVCKLNTKIIQKHTPLPDLTGIDLSEAEDIYQQLLKSRVA